MAGLQPQQHRESQQHCKELEVDRNVQPQQHNVQRTQRKEKNNQKQEQKQKQKQKQEQNEYCA
jgi:hypothetical protein